MSAIYIRNIIFGIVDSLVSTVGFLAGASAGGASGRVIILVGVVYAIVEGFSMAVGSFLSEESVEEFIAKKELPAGMAVAGGTIMFFSSVLAALIPIAPYFFLQGSQAILTSFTLSMLSLFAAGAVIAKISHLKYWRHGLKMVLLGSGATILGIVVGNLLKID